ncbi:J domain-containing protein [Shewanella japonica]|uniref:J domain-containing protein n=1 Tax=Shewanella japonica TaxID=93973 RepID=A0ABM6JN02_9GAMM|nr:DnaJ domain-containing protein [Shewanella japonica]ARD23700.1 hypothetical protein SJ2017_3449 [Shewanella japonica]
MENLYLTLGISQDADAEEISAAYESLYLFYHSDDYQSEYADTDVKLANIAVSYDILKSVTKRRAYDELWQHYQQNKSSDLLVDVPDMDYEFEVDGDHMAQWTERVEQYPQLQELFDNLSGLSMVLAISFKAYLIESQRFEEAERLAYIMCAQYIRRFFDEEQNIKPLAEGLLSATSVSEKVTVDELFKLQGIEVNIENEVIDLTESIFKHNQNDFDSSHHRRRKTTQKEGGTSPISSQASTEDISTQIEGEHRLSQVTPRAKSATKLNEPLLSVTKRRVCKGVAVIVVSLCLLVSVSIVAF